MRAVFLFPDGGTKEAVPDTLSLRRDSDTPADSLEMEFLADAPLFDREPTGVRAERDGETVFLGIVDEHGVRLDGRGRREFFSCRSLAARMIDCEALPGVLQDPSLRLLEQRFLLPIGLKLGAGDAAPKRGTFTVEKGVSVWRAMCDFGRAFLKTEPHCSRDGTVVFAKREPRRFCLSGAARAEVIRRPYSAVSRVAVQNVRNGTYTAVWENPDAKGICRIRYLSAHARTSPKALIEAGERGRLAVRLVFEGYFDGDPGDAVEAEGIEGVRETLAVERVRFTADGTGETTELYLVRGE